MSEARVREAGPLSFITETVPEAIFFADHQGRITYANAAACTMFGRPYDALVGAPLTVIMPERFHAAHREGLARFIAHGESRMMGTIVELEAIRADGNEFPVEVSLSANGDGEDIILVAFMRDISARKATEGELVERAQQISVLKDQLERERDYLREELRESGSFGPIVGSSTTLRAALEQVDAVAHTDATVLIHGESGVGKELFARAIHDRSRRASRALVRVNCASVPKELFESEFFGHVKGAFTGAVKDREGRFQLADGGTLFLDEVGEIPLDLQGKLLRVLQEQEFERVGEARTRSVDVRIVAATNRNLAEEIAAGRFREDLYYRLNVFPIAVPPLRERREDVPALARHFLRVGVLQSNLPQPEVRAEDERRLMAYDWPGNIRELQNVMQRAAILSRGGALQLALALPERTGAGAPSKAEVAAEPSQSAIEEALAAHDGNISKAAAQLGLSRQSLYRRMAKLGLGHSHT